MDSYLLARPLATAAFREPWKEVKRVTVNLTGDRQGMVSGEAQDAHIKNVRDPHHSQQLATGSDIKRAQVQPVGENCGWYCARRRVRPFLLLLQPMTANAAGLAALVL